MAKRRKGPGGSGASARAEVAAKQQQLAAAARRRRRLTQLIVVGVVAVVAIGIVASAVLLGRSGSDARPSASTTVTVAGASVPFGTADSGIRVGQDDAPVKLDLWVDYSCPHCQEWEATNNASVGTLVAAGTLQVTYHNIQVVTAYGTEAGSAAACVATYQPEKWWDVNAALYANHSASTDSWRGSQLWAWAKQQGVDNPEAESCIQDRTYRGWIAANTTASDAAGVQGTPTLFFNGVKENGIPSGAEFTAKVQQLAAAG